MSLQLPGFRFHPTGESILTNPPLSWLLLLGALTAFAPMSIDMYLPSLPAIADRIRHRFRRRPIHPGQFLYRTGAGSGPSTVRLPIVTAASRRYMPDWRSTSWPRSAARWPRHRHLDRAAVRAGDRGCAGVVIARAVVRDRFDARTSAKIYSLLMLVMGLAPILAPIMGGWILALASWRAIFGVLALFGFATLLLSWRHLPETRPANAIGDGRSARPCASTATCCATGISSGTP